MTNSYLHILAFNVPYPANYGGLIDIYYRIRALSGSGTKIILHCYQYGRQTSKELEELCYQVHYHPRRSGLKYFFSARPYIVATRNAKTVPNILLEDDHPVLFEGLHCTSALKACQKAGKTTLVRAHNIEHRYYRELARSERSLWQKLYLASEAFKLRAYEKVLRRCNHILAIASHEQEYFRKTYGHSTLLPPFHRFDRVLSRPGRGKYIFYHGNLSVAENWQSILGLLRGELNTLPHPVVIAGKGPSVYFREQLALFPNVSLIADPDDQEMDRLMQEAQISLLFTAQSTGIKLKLLHSLYMGRFCIANRSMTEGTGLSSLCIHAEDPASLPKLISKYMQEEFSQEEIDKRSQVLSAYSCSKGIDILRGIIG